MNSDLVTEVWPQEWRLSRNPVPVFSAEDHGGQLWPGQGRPSFDVIYDIIPCYNSHDWRAAYFFFLMSKTGFLQSVVSPANSNKWLITGFASSRLELIKFLFTITRIMLLMFYEIYVLLVPTGFTGRWSKRHLSSCQRKWEIPVSQILRALLGS